MRETEHALKDKQRKKKRDAPLQRKDGHESADGGARAGHVARRRGPASAGSAADELEVLPGAGKDGGRDGGGEHPASGDHDAAGAQPDGDAHEDPLLQLPGLVGLPGGGSVLPAAAADAAGGGGYGGGREQREAAAEAERRRGRQEEAEAEWRVRSRRGRKQEERGVEAGGRRRRHGRWEVWGSGACRTDWRRRFRSEMNRDFFFVY